MNGTGHDPGGANAAILLTEEERCDPDVLAFMAASVRAKREEKLSDPADWTAQESAAYSRGDWRTFSRLRGYTEAEIANFGEFVRLAGVLDTRYGRDYATSLSFAIDEATAGQLASQS